MTISKTNNRELTANDIQIGGQHYKLNTIQPWDYILANNIGYMEGSAIKYLTRWKTKGGIDDLKKAKHFIDRLIEEEEKKVKDEAFFGIVTGG